MSGGHFDYWQHHIAHIAESVETLIENNDNLEKNDWGDPIGRGYSPEVIQRFREALPVLKAAYIYAQRIDWLVSGDDGEAQFLRRLERELADMQEKQA